MENRIKPVFDQIRAEEPLKQRTMAYLAERTKPADRKYTGFRLGKLAAAICALALILGGWSLYQRPTASISIDINPSVELSVNCFDRVISTRAYNEDGRMLLEQVAVMHLSCEEAVERILEEDTVSELLYAGELVMLSVIGPEGSQVERIISGMEACAAVNEQAQCCYTAPETAEQAREAGISAGKYRAFLELRELDPNVTVEDIRDLTMRQIRDLMEQLNTGDAETMGPEETELPGHHGNGSGNQDGHNGNGQGNGNGNGYRGSR